MIKFYEEDIKVRLTNRSHLRKCIGNIITDAKYGEGDIAIVFCSDDYLLQINRQYLEHDYYTDIITFNYNNGNLISGDLIISYERVRENARTYKTNTKQELLRVIIHGILHLTGYEDNSKNNRKEMREKEEYYLKLYYNIEKENVTGV